MLLYILFTSHVVKSRWCIRLILRRLSWSLHEMYESFAHMADGWSTNELQYWCYYGSTVILPSIQFVYRLSSTLVRAGICLNNALTRLLTLSLFFTGEQYEKQKQLKTLDEMTFGRQYRALRTWRILSYAKSNHKIHLCKDIYF